MSDAIPFDPRLPLPAWVTRLRNQQVDAVSAVAAAFDAGYGQVFCDAPTGSGKTLLGEVLRRSLGVRALYLCTTTQLQAQVLRDFPYACVIKGRKHYPTELFPDVTCDACEGKLCGYCSFGACPYALAKQAALGAQLAVANTAYFLSEANNLFGEFGLRKDGRPAFDLVIIDEADRLEATLMGVISLEFTHKQLNLWRVAPPLTTDAEVVAPWLERKVLPAIRQRLAAFEARVEQLEGRTRAAVRRQIAEYEELEARTVDVINEYGEGNWVLCETAIGIAFRPVSVREYGRTWLWQHAPRWLLMSASLIRPRIMAHELGLPLIDEAQIVTVPSTFPAARRPIYALDVARLTRNVIDVTLPKVLDALDEIIIAYPGERVLVHCHSKRILGACRDRFGDLARAKWYTTPQDREAVVAAYLATPAAVLFSLAMDRGVDLPDDACRVVIIIKMPFADLGDAQVAARKARSGGDVWYDVTTIRTLVQASGRGMRHAEDWVCTYILDASFKTFFARQHRNFPPWWRDAVVTPRAGTFPVFTPPQQTRVDESRYAATKGAR
jgi:Rad3-related DNA helicase